ncbi:hypothetical protein AMECASPLE_037384 [Ameca splendens]|uniref:Uncharacterized protein n=2 Tax=Goodeidae TaxID=28758 RepID=A0ABV0P2N2_9TELE
MSTDDVMIKKKSLHLRFGWIQRLEQELNSCLTPLQIPEDGQCNPSLSWWGYVILVLFSEPTFGGFCCFWVQLSSCVKSSSNSNHNLACTTNTEAAPSMMTNF